MPRVRLSDGMAAALLAWLVACACAPAAEVVLDEDFGGPTPSWHVRTSGGVRPLAQLRTQSPDAHRPVTSERVVLACPAGYAAQVAHAVGKLPVLDELAVELVVRANRPGLQLAAEVVFPRSADPKTGNPLRTLVHGRRYADPGQWQTLELAKVPLLATRYARLLSADPKQQVDTREAYVDQIVLVVPGGPGESLLEIDRLTIRGVSEAGDGPSTNNSPVAVGDMDGPLLQAPGTSAQQSTERFEPVDIRRHGAALTVAGVPLVPRVVEYRGEPLDLLAELGFNTVWMAETPTEAQLRAARAARLWVVCPPPAVDTLRQLNADSVWQTVLAWSMGFDQDATALDGIASVVDEIRRADPLARPLVVGAADRPRRFSQLVDILVSDRPLPLDGVLSRRDPHDMQPMGCSPWTQISVGWSVPAKHQAELLAPRARNLGWHDAYQVRHAVLDALAADTHGVVIRTPERLSRNSPEARQLVDQLQLMNQELALIEPWITTGKRSAGAELLGATSYTTSWQLGQSRLIYVPRQTLASTTAEESRNSLPVAGVPETAKAHLLSPAGLTPLVGHRVAGGYRVQLDGLDAGAFVLLTEDTRTLAQVQRRIGGQAARAAQAERGLAMAEVSQLEAIRSQLFDPADRTLTVRIAALKKGVQQCDQLLAARQYPQATHVARQVRHEAASEMRRLSATMRGPGFVSVPTQYEPRLLPTHQALEQTLHGLPRGGNLLAGGDFEDLSSTRQAGWVHANYAEARHETAVEFTPDHPYHGGACLRLRARATGQPVYTDDAKRKPVVWITSPEVTVPPGTVVELTGWARVATQWGDDHGDLLVVDNLGGEELGLRIPATTGWQPFRMVRTVDERGSIRLNLALSGAASADVDAVMIRPVQVPRRTAAVDASGAKQ